MISRKGTNNGGWLRNSGEPSVLTVILLNACSDVRVFAFAVNFCARVRSLRFALPSLDASSGEANACSA